VYHNKGVQEHITHLKDAEDLENIDSSPHNNGGVNTSKMIRNGHVAHTENKKYTQNLSLINQSIDQSIYLSYQSVNQSINHFYCCKVKTGHISAVIPHDEKTTIESKKPQSPVLRKS